MEHFRPAAAELFFSRQDSLDPRLGDLTQKASSETNISEDNIYIGGYPDDEGIGLNGGRQGAKEAPDAVRRSLYRMTPPPHLNLTPAHLWDVGNLETSPDLEQRHIQAQQMAQSVLEQGGRWVGIGGGHDYGYPDGAAFLEATLSKGKYKPIVINFDAHLDVRSTEKGISSGTPFYRLLEKYGDQFDFVELGVQYHCNSAQHIDWCRERGVKILFWEDILYASESPSVVVSRFLEQELLRPRPAFISIDIDGFDSSYAMGCSQSWPTGWSPQDFFPLFHLLLSRWQVKTLGIYEVSPKYDLDSRTAKLAAQIIHKFLFHGMGGTR